MLAGSSSISGRVRNSLNLDETRDSREREATSRNSRSVAHALLNSPQFHEKYLNDFNCTSNEIGFEAIKVKDATQTIQTNERCNKFPAQKSSRF